MEPLRVCITGAAGQIGYILCFQIAKGELCPGRRVILQLLEITPVLPALNGVVMELTDCAFPLLAGVIPTDDPAVAFKDADVVFQVGAMPRKGDMTRADLLEKNGGIFRAQGQAIAAHAKKTVKVLVVGNPCNTNALICHKFAPGIPAMNIHAMTRLDHNRAIGELSFKLGVTADKIHNVYVWGNHSSTQVPDVSTATVDLPEGNVKIVDKLPLDYLHGEFVTKVATRGGAIIKARGASSAASAAQAAMDHVRDWILGTKPGQIVSKAFPVPECQPYGIKPGVVFSFPVTVDAHGVVHIVQNLPVNDWLRGKLDATEAELHDEKAQAFQVLGIN